MKRFLRFVLYINHRIIYRTIRQALQRRLIGLSAEIAFNVMLSLFPIMIMALTLLGLVTDQLDMKVLQLARYYQDVMPISVWNLLGEFAQEISKTPSKGLFSVSFIATIWVSSGALSAAMNALDQIHEIPMAQRRPFWKAKLMSIVITLGAVALLIFASFLVLVGDSMVKIGSDLVVRLPVDTTGIYVLVTLWKLLSYPLALALGAGMLAMISNILMRPADRRYPLRKLKKLTIWIAISTSSLIGLCFLIVFIQNLIINLKIDYDIANLLVILWRFLSLPLALAIVSIAFAFIYSVGSSRIITGMPVLPGAILGAISWGIISSLFRLYVSNFGQYNRVYGAVGTAIILMLWLQLSALVMLIGDQLNAVIHDAMLEDAHQQTDTDFTSPATREVNIDSIMEANLDEYKNPPLTEEA